MKALASEKGSAYVEFIIAIVPMLTVFWGIMQLNGLMLADLVARHAAVNAVRAAIVCDSQKNHVQEEGTLTKEGGCAYDAAKMTLSAVKSFGEPEPEFAVRVEGAEEHGNEPVTATVFATYHCQVPLAGAILCGGLMHDEGGGSRRGALVLRRSATLPNQGASYELGKHE
jgi:hypothetical protein